MSKVRLRSAETVEEVDWLLGGGMSPVNICEAMGSTPGAISKAAWRCGRTDLFSLFEKLRKEYK